MPQLSTYLTDTALHRISRILKVTNILQMMGCIICALVFILATTMSAGPSDKNPFSFSMQILGLGLYLTVPIGSVAFALRKDPNEQSLRLSQILSGIAIGVGVVPIILIFQNYLDPILPVFFAFGYLTNIPAFLLRTIPQGLILQRKKRGAPVGDWGNLNGMRIEMEISKKGRFILYLVFFAIFALFILSRVAASSPSLIVWFPLVILLSVSVIGITAYLQGGKSGWQQATLDTFENQTLWWYTADGVLASVLLKNPYVELQDSLVKISLVKGGLPTSLRFYSRADCDNFFAITGLSDRHSDTESHR